MSFPIYLLQAVAFLDLFAIGLIVPLVPGHVRKMGGNHIYVGLLGSIYAGFQLASGPLIGSLSDLKGRKIILIMTLFVCAAAYTIMGLTKSILVILLLRAILGLFKQTQMLTKALVPDYEKSETKQSAIYGQMAAISGGGITLGPIVGGHIAEADPEYGFTLVAVLVGICFVANTGLVYLIPKSKNQPSRKRNKKKVQISLIDSFFNNMSQTVNELYKVEWREYWDVFLFKALVGFAMGVYYSNYALYLKTQYGLSPKYIGYVISFQGTVASVSSFCIGYINGFYKHDKDYSLRMFHIFVLLSVSLLGLIMSFSVYTYILWLVPIAIGNAVGRLVTLEMVLKRSHGDHRGTLIGASNSVRSLSGVASPMVAGFIGQYFGVPKVIYASLCSTTLGVVLSYYQRSKRQKLD